MAHWAVSGLLRKMRRKDSVSCVMKGGSPGVSLGEAWQVMGANNWGALEWKICAWYGCKRNSLHRTVKISVWKWWWSVWCKDTERHKNLFKIAIYPKWIQRELKITGQELSLHRGQLDHIRATVTNPTHSSNTWYLDSNRVLGTWKSSKALSGTEWHTGVGKQVRGIV